MGDSGAAGNGRGYDGSGRTQDSANKAVKEDWVQNLVEDLNQIGLDKLQ